MMTDGRYPGKQRKGADPHNSQKPASLGRQRISLKNKVLKRQRK
jgi:hypothetical protein